MTPKAAANQREPEGTTRVGARELRRDIASWIRRAGRGERIVVTVNGTATAQLTDLASRTPNVSGSGGLDLHDLANAGLITPPLIIDSMGQALGQTAEPARVSEAVVADVNVDRLLAQIRGQHLRSRS